MLKLLVPVDGSPSSSRAVDYTVRLAGRGESIQVHLLHVQRPIMAGEISSLVSKEMLDELRREQSETATRAARERFSEAGIEHVVHIERGETAHTIADCARTQACDGIVMGTRGMGAIGNLVLGSVATKVIHLASVPVTLVK